MKQDVFLSIGAGDTLLDEASRVATKRPLSRPRPRAGQLKPGDYDRAAKVVTYRSDKSEGPTAGTETADPLEFLARVLTHIPDKGQVTTRYYGWYANRPRGMRRQTDPAAADAPVPIVPAVRAGRRTTLPGPHAGSSRGVQSRAILPRPRLNFLSCRRQAR